MTTEVRTCSPEDAIVELMEVMTLQRIRHLPVVRNGALEGIVSIGDVVKQRLAGSAVRAERVAELHFFGLVADASAALVGGAGFAYDARRARHHPHDVPDELPSDAVRDAGRRRGRTTSSASAETRTTRTAAASCASAVRPRARSSTTRAACCSRWFARDAATSCAAPRGTRRWISSPSACGGGARGGRHLGGARTLHQQLWHPRRLASGAPLLEPLRLSVVEPDDDLLGPRRLRPGAHRHPRDQHQGGHGRALGIDCAVGREPRKPAEHGAPPAWPPGGAAPMSSRSTCAAPKRPRSPTRRS